MLSPVVESTRPGFAIRVSRFTVRSRESVNAWLRSANVVVVSIAIGRRYSRTVRSWAAVSRRVMKNVSRAESPARIAPVVVSLFLMGNRWPTAENRKIARPSTMPGRSAASMTAAWFGST